MERGLQSGMKPWMKRIIFSLMFFFLNHIKLMDIHIKTLNLINIDIFTYLLINIHHQTIHNITYTLANIYGPNNVDLSLFHSFFSFIKIIVYK